MKNIVIAIGVVVMVLIGMNQWQSYKLNKRANDVIEYLQTGVKTKSTKDTESSQVRSTFFKINSGISTLRQKRILSGNMNPITDLNKDGHIFGKVLGYPKKNCITDGLATGCWGGSGSLYTYTTTEGDTIVFNFNGKKLKCITGCDKYN